MRGIRVKGERLQTKMSSYAKQTGAKVFSDALFCSRAIQEDRAISHGLLMTPTIVAFVHLTFCIGFRRPTAYCTLRNETKRNAKRNETKRFAKRNETKRNALRNVSNLASFATFFKLLSPSPKNRFTTTVLLSGTYVAFSTNPKLPFPISSLSTTSHQRKLGSILLLGICFE